METKIHTTGITLLDDFKIKEQGFYEPSPIKLVLVPGNRVDQDDYFYSKMTSVGWPQPTQFMFKVLKIADLVKLLLESTELIGKIYGVDLKALTLLVGGNTFPMVIIKCHREVIVT